jgi:DNA-directed RNA polymerase subunit RPC12/RpoP
VRYRCSNCEAFQWRGFFPEQTFHLRYAVLHGVALGVCGIFTRAVFAYIGYSTDGWRNGLASLGVCAALIIGFYGVAIMAEAVAVARRRCQECGGRGLHLA